MNLCPSKPCPKKRLFFRRWRHSRIFLIAIVSGCLGDTISSANAQIFLSPQSTSATRSSATIDIDNTRCSSSGGSVPSLSLSFGADPYAVNYFNDFDPVNTTTASSPFLGMVSINIPLKRTNQHFNCNELHDLAVRRSKLASLREMVDEQIITEDQYTTAVQNLYKNLLYGDGDSADSDSRIEQATEELKIERDNALKIN